MWLCQKNIMQITLLAHIEILQIPPQQSVIHALLCNTHPPSNRRRDYCHCHSMLFHSPCGVNINSFFNVVLFCYGYSTIEQLYKCSRSAPKSLDVIAGTLISCHTMLLHELEDFHCIMSLLLSVGRLLLLLQTEHSIRHQKSPHWELSQQQLLQ
jgi:hypothetical protein